MDVLGLEFLSWKMTRSVSFESEKCISQQKYTREHVERKRLMIPLAWLKLAIRLLIIFFFSLSFLFFSFSLYSWQSIIICKKSSLLYNLLNQVSWDQINLSITKHNGLKIKKSGYIWKCVPTTNNLKNPKLLFSLFLAYCNNRKTYPWTLLL